MGILPFDKWEYHLDFRRDEVNRKHDDVVKIQNTVDSRIKLFNHQLDKFKSLIANNALLIYIDNTVRMQDLELRNFTVTVDALPPPVKGSNVITQLAGLTELIGGFHVLKFVFNLGKLVKDAIWPVAEESTARRITVELIDDLSADAADVGLVNTADTATTESLENISEEVTEEVVATSTSATLAATGIGILLAVGLDAIFGAINGAREAQDLDDILTKLDSKMTIVKGYLSTIETKSGDVTTNTVTQIGTFKKVVAAMKNLLPPDHAPTVDTSFPDSADSLDKCLAAQQTAIEQFGILSQLRTTYISALDNRRDPTKESVANSVLLRSPPWVTKQILYEIWDNVLAKYSTLMKNAK